MPYAPAVLFYLLFVPPLLFFPRCLDECPRLYSNGVTGRICDENCATRVFGFVGCRAKNNLFGTNCRLCYVNEEDALEVDDIENNERAIM